MAKSPLRTARELEDEMVKLRIEQNPQIGPVGDDELEKFRMEWRQEVKSRRPGQPKVQSKSQPQPQPQLLSPASPDKRVYPQPGPTSKGKEKNASKGEEKNLHEKPTTSPSTSPRAIKQPLSNHDASHGSKVSGTSRSPEKERVKFPKSIERRAGTKTSQEDAVSIYARAVEAEQGGQLNDALNLYRQAFRLDGGFFLSRFGLLELVYGLCWVWTDHGRWFGEDKADSASFTLSQSLFKVSRD